MAYKDPRAKQILALLDSRRKSIRWLAREIGHNQAAVNNWLSGINGPRDDSVWDTMLRAVSPNASAKPSIVAETRTVYRTGIRVIPLAGEGYAGVPLWGASDVTEIEVKDWGNNFDRWGKVVSGSSMSPLLEPGDIAIFENRRHEIGHVVHANKEGYDVLKVLAPTLLRSANREFEDVPNVGYDVLGVLVMRIRDRGQGVTETTEYRHGATWRFEPS